MKLQDFIKRLFRKKRGWLAVLCGQAGAQLVEFALVLPLLAVLVVGIADFGAGYALKDKLTNAARDGARIRVSQGNDITRTACGGAPCSVQAGATAVVNYLTNAHVDVCGLTPSSTSPASGPAAFTWTYTSPSNCPGTTSSMSIVIDGAFLDPVGGGLLTRVTINYPFKWSFGGVIGLLSPSATYPRTLTLSSAAAMPNI